MENSTRLKAVIHMDAVEANFEAMRKKLADGTKMAAVIKADAYGHGALEIAHLMEPKDYIWGFAVATDQEALELRAAGIRKPVLILGIVFDDMLEELAAQDIRITVCSSGQAGRFAEAGKKAGKDVKVHLAVDTGMSRIGFADHPGSLEEIRRIFRLDGLTVEGIFTHFARADEEDPAPAVVQLKRFLAFTEFLEKEGLHIPVHHCSNSAGIMRMPEANLDLVRAGITIYGIYPSEEMPKELLPLRPVMELKSHITFVKKIPAGTAVSYGGTFVSDHDMMLATVPAGYADGYPRQLSGKGWVLIRGQKAGICGRVCMDQFMVDVTDIKGVQAGDEVTLLGRDGEEEIRVETLGALCGRFPYEFVCDISKRVPREYI